eukprot:g12377.t1
MSSPASRRSKPLLQDRTSPSGLRTAAWEKKWRDMEADLQDAALKPEGLPAMPSALRSQVQASDNDEDAEIFALQSLTRFVASDLQVRLCPRAFMERQCRMCFF